MRIKTYEISTLFYKCETSLQGQSFLAFKEKGKLIRYIVLITKEETFIFLGRRKWSSEHQTGIEIFYRVNNTPNKIGAHNFMLKTFCAKRAQTQHDPLVSSTSWATWFLVQFFMLMSESGPGKSYQENKAYMTIPNCSKASTSLCLPPAWVE